MTRWPVRTSPRETRPVTTVPRPVIVKTSSIWNAKSAPGTPTSTIASVTTASVIASVGASVTAVPGQAPTPSVDADGPAPRP